MYDNVELRKLPVGSLYSVIDVLEINADWKKVMSHIPKNLSSDVFEPKYNSEHMRLIEENAKVTGRKCADILFEEWGSSGKLRPTLRNLQSVLIKAEIFRAIEEVALMMREAPPVRPADGPAAKINTDISSILRNASIEQNLKDLNPKRYKYLPTTNNKTTHKIGWNATIQNQTTTKMKSNETTYSTTQLPNWSNLQPEINNKERSTQQMVSEDKKNHVSDMMKFSVPSINIENTEDIPNFSNLLARSGNDSSHVNLESQSESDSHYSESSQSHTSFQNSKSKIDSSILQDTNLIHFEYKEIIEITKNFSKSVGAGGFGEVFVGFHPIYGNLAIKKSHTHSDIAIKAFNSEVRSLSQFKHKNIVPILGYSRDGPSLCVVCQYMEGGSLDEKIARKELSEKQRINIIMGIAEGLRYLHSNNGTFDSPTESLIHGDVKSANVLLTADGVPKLCDFGISKSFDKTYETMNPMMGTSAYMAPEGFSGTVTKKIDIFSFGIVLLELLTGLKPIVQDNGEQKNIIEYVKEKCPDEDISNLLDKSVDKWIKAKEIYQLAKKCLRHEWNERPSIEEVCRTLVNINK